METGSRPKEPPATSSLDTIQGVLYQCFPICPFGDPADHRKPGGSKDVAPLQVPTDRVGKRCIRALRCFQDSSRAANGYGVLLFASFELVSE